MRGAKSIGWLGNGGIQIDLFVADVFCDDCFVVEEVDNT